MAKPPTYGLQALLELRARKAASATVELGDAVRARETAEREEGDAVAAEQQTAAEAAAIGGAESEQLAAGALRVGDLVQGDAWKASARAHAAELANATASAARESAAARAAEAEARRGVAHAAAERDVIAKDRERFQDGIRRSAENDEEVEAADVHNGRRQERKA